MSRKELNQVGIFEKLRNKEIKQNQAAKILNLTERQVREKIRAYRSLGPPSLIHGLRGKPSNNQLDPKIIEEALGLVTEKYPDFGPTFAAEKLAEIHHIKINRETLRLKMTKVGLWKPKKKKPHHREWRERKECLGELVQLDGSDHDWFEGRSEKCTILAFIDDAASKILHLEFARETTLEVMIATKRYILKHGLPSTLYVDRGKVFKVNLGNENDERVTQYERALSELSVGVTHARSPQAKGRVERLFGTLQDRLVKEMRLREISTIEEANRFIEDEYLPKHNQKYSVPAKSSANLHRSAENYNLDDALCIKEKRILTNDFTIRYKNKWFQLERKQKTILFPKDSIIVITRLDGETKLMIRDIKLSFHKIDKLEAKKTIKTNVRKERKPWRPAADHPWKTYNIDKLKPEVSTLQKAEVSTLV